MTPLGGALLSSEPIARTPLPSRFQTLEAGRFIAAMSVVLFHASATTSMPKYLGYYAAPYLAGGFAGVEFFFVLSGFVIALAHRGELLAADHRRYAGRFLYKRFVRLYPALWSILIVLVPAMYLIPALRWNGPISLGDVVAAFAVTPIERERILAVAWTLRYEVLFYALFALSLWNRLAGAIGFTIMIGLALACYVMQASGIMAFFVAPYPLLFVAGVLIAFAAASGPLRYARTALAVGAAIFAWRLALWAGHPDAPGKVVSDITLFGVGAALIIYGLVGWEIQRRIDVPGWLLYLGRASYSIYLIHYPAMSVFAKIGKKLHGETVPTLYVYGIAAAAIAAGIVFHELIEKPVVRWTTSRQSALRTT